MTNSEKITQKMEAVCLQILRDSRSELYLNMRYLDLALSGLRFSISTQIEGIGTDGEYLVAHPGVLADLFQKDRHLVNRVYLHIVLHCLMRHLFKKPGRDGLLWRISCDIAVESIIDSMHSRAVWMGISRLRNNVYDDLRRERKVLTAEGIYRTLERKAAEGKLTAEDVRRMQDDFCIDDHSLWPHPEDGREKKKPEPPMAILKNKWDDLSEKTQTQMETFAKDASHSGEQLLDDLKVENRERYDYRAFLRKFAVMREEMQVDPDSFDYVFYTYGLSMYGNMPLIEPQEYREVKKIEEFVVVIDVSMSTSGQLVRTFLEQTCSVLTESESYLKKVNIRIIQCDEQIRDDVRITNRRELEEYMNHFTLHGGGGTDFRPAFAYVEKLIENRQFYNLKGMIYFTDGRGIYPSRRPGWETAFVFMQEDYEDVHVPAWAIRLVLPREDLEDSEPSLRTDRHFIWKEEPE